MAFQLLIGLLACSLATVNAGLLPNLDFHYQHSPHSAADDHPLQKLSAGYEAPAHQYQVAEPAQRHQQAHLEHIQPSSTPTVQQHSDAVYLAPDVRRQQHGAQQPQQQHHYPKNSADDAAVEFRPAVVSAPLKTTVYLKPRSQPHQTVEYSIQPGQRLIAYDSPAVYEPHQNRAHSHFGRALYAPKPQQFEQQDIVETQKSAVFHPIYFHAAEEERDDRPVTPATVTLVKPQAVYIPHQQTLAAAVQQYAPVYSHRQPEHYNSVGAPTTSAPVLADHHHQQPRPVYVPQQDVAAVISPHQHAPVYQHQLQSKPILVVPSPPQRGLIAPAAPAAVAQHQQQPRYFMSHQPVVPVHKTVSYSPAEAVSHLSFQSANAQYAW